MEVYYLSRASQAARLDDFCALCPQECEQLWHRLQYDPSASLSTDVPVQQDWTGQPTPSQLQGNY